MWWVTGKRSRLIGLPVDIFSTQVALREAGQQRLTGFKRWYKSDAAAPRLCVAALSLRVTLHAVNITAQKPHADRGDVPMLVRLGRREVQQKACRDVSHVLQHLHLDAALPQAAAVKGIMTTLTHLLIRFEAYQAFPTRIWTLSHRFNSVEHVVRIVDFLDLPEDELDTGYTLPLQRRALAEGTMDAAIEFLASDVVQAEIDLVLDRGLATTLDVERKHSTDKTREKRKVSSVGRLSRVSIMSRYQRERYQRRDSARHKRAHVVKTKFMNHRALAIQRRPKLMPRGRGFGGEPRDSTSLDQYIDEHRDELVSAAAQLREHSRQLEISSKDAMGIVGND